MALSAANMAQGIVNKVKELNEGVDAEREAELVAYWTKICEGIIAELANAVVAPGSFTSPGGGGAITGTGGGIS